MSLKPIAFIGLLITIVIAAYVQGKSNEKEQQIFGLENDVIYAKKLWQVMENESLVGKNAKQLEPFFGGANPHGMILEIDQKLIQVSNHVGFVVVKKNYNGPGVTVDAVKENRAKFLSSITVMYQREVGYDSDNQNWFWVKYKPDGSLFDKPVQNQKIHLAGRIIKGKTWGESGGCIYCHSSAGSGDYIFYPEIKLPRAKQ